MVEIRADPFHRPSTIPHRPSLASGGHRWGRVRGQVFPRRRDPTMIGPRMTWMARPPGLESGGRVGIKGLGGLIMIRAQPDHALRRPGAMLALTLGAILALAAEGRADVINFTGNVNNDFPASVGHRGDQRQPLGRGPGPLHPRERLDERASSSTRSGSATTRRATPFSSGSRDTRSSATPTAIPTRPAPTRKLKAAGGVNPAQLRRRQVADRRLRQRRPGRRRRRHRVRRRHPRPTRPRATPRNTNDFTVATYNNYRPGAGLLVRDDPQQPRRPARGQPDRRRPPTSSSR